MLAGRPIEEFRRKIGDLLLRRGFATKPRRDGEAVVGGNTAAQRMPRAVSRYRRPPIASHFDISTRRSTFLDL